MRTIAMLETKFSFNAGPSCLSLRLHGFPRPLRTTGQYGREPDFRYFRVKNFNSKKADIRFPHRRGVVDPNETFLCILHNRR